MSINVTADFHGNCIENIISMPIIIIVSARLLVCLLYVIQEGIFGVQFIQMMRNILSDRQCESESVSIFMVFYWHCTHTHKRMRRRRKKMLNNFEGIHLEQVIHSLLILNIKSFLSLGILHLIALRRKLHPIEWDE